jgi:hypothetical protein
MVEELDRPAIRTFIEEHDLPFNPNFFADNSTMLTNGSLAVVNNYLET